MKDITFDRSRKLENPLYIDVRAPVEFEQDHIPGAMSVPIFDDEQRKEIGTMYRLAGRDPAVIRGAEIVGGKIASIVGEISRDRDRNIVIYCARGGMRSMTISGLLNSLGIRVYRLIQGYKGYREYMRGYFSGLKVTSPVFLLQGLTGTGKTEILKNIKTAIDLEDMAGHRSSVFGGVGLNQHSQKMFESLLFSRIEELAGARYIVVEGESQKIGNLHIPEAFFRTMRSSPMILVTAPMERRIRITVKEYAPCSSCDIIDPIVTGLSLKMGKAMTEELKSLYRQGRLEEFARILLEKYYDPGYMHAFKKYNFIATVENRDSMAAAAEIEEIIKKQIINFT
jgi:tRNA 2-selenouridine synthase